MKILHNLFILILLTAVNPLIYPQTDSITIKEGEVKIICGRIVIVDAFWISEGYTKADISILEKQNSKPITGGYKSGDEITISSEPGCTYYIYSVIKNGKQSGKGSVTFSKTPPDIKPGKIKNEIIMEENSSYSIDDYSWYVNSIRKENGNTTGYITITEKTNLIENLELTEGEIIWIGNKQYKTESIEPRLQHVKTDPEKIYEPLPGKIIFSLVKELR